MIVFIVSLAVIGFFAWYVVAGRTWLKPKPWMAWLYKSRFGIWCETVLFEKSETKLWARAKGLAAALFVILPQIGAIDLMPILMFIPDEYHWIRFIPSAALMLDSVVGEMQRNRTTMPVEMVVLSEAKDELPPKVAQAIEGAEKAKEKAVAVVAEAKKEGAV